MRGGQVHVYPATLFSHAAGVPASLDTGNYFEHLSRLWAPHHSACASLNQPKNKQPTLLSLFVATLSVHLTSMRFVTSSLFHAILWCDHCDQGVTASYPASSPTAPLQVTLTTSHTHSWGSATLIFIFKFFEFFKVDVSDFYMSICWVAWGWWWWWTKWYMWCYSAQDNDGISRLDKWSDFSESEGNFHFIWNIWIEMYRETSDKK